MSSLDIWHQRLGHCAYDIVAKALQGSNIIFNPKKSFHLCQSCSFAKMHRLPYSPSSSEHNTPLALIHSDLWGPAPITSTNGFVYYVSFIDHCTRFTWLYLPKSKGEVSSVFVAFKKMVENQFGHKIKALQTDWGESIEA